MLFVYGKISVAYDWHVQEPHAVLFSRIYYVLNGTATYQDNNTQITLKKGYLYCLPTNKPYEVTRSKSEPFEVLFLHADIAPFVLSHCAEIFVDTEGVLHNALKTCGKYCESSKTDPTLPLSQAIFAPVIEYLKASNVFTPQKAEIQTSISYIAQNLEKDLSLEKLSAITGYHTQHYIRLFKKATGTTPHQFILQYRMKKGYLYLCSGKNVEETASLVGFSHAKNFSRAFKNYFGVFPSQIRKNLMIDYI